MNRRFLKHSLIVTTIYLFVYHLVLLEIEAPFRSLFLFGNFLNTLISGYIPAVGIMLLVDHHERKTKAAQYSVTVMYHLENIRINFEKAFELLPKSHSDDELKKFCEGLKKNYNYEIADGILYIDGYNLLIETWETIDKELDLLLQNNPLGFDETKGYCNLFRNNNLYKKIKSLNSSLKEKSNNLDEILRYKSVSFSVTGDDGKKSCLEAIFLYEAFENLKKNTELLYL